MRPPGEADPRPKGLDDHHDDETVGTEREETDRTAGGREVGGDRRASDNIDSATDLDTAIARLLTFGSYASVGLLAVGVVLLAFTGQSTLGGAFERFDLRRVPADIVALRPEGFLWLGLVVVVATPAARVTASLVGYMRRRETLMIGVSIAILLVIATSVVVSVGLGS